MASDRVHLAIEMTGRKPCHDPLIQIQVAPSNLHWLSDKALETAGELSRSSGAPLHMHVLETP